MPNLTLLRARNLLKKEYKVFPSRINIQCVQKVWKHPKKIEKNDFREKRKNR
jgi:hypothetical protein